MSIHDKSDSKNPIIGIGSSPGGMQSEEKLAEVRYKAIVNSAIDGFWFADCEGNLRDVNDAYCAMTGFTREELLQMTISDVDATETPAETARKIRHLMDVGYSRFETRHRCKDGHIVDIEVSAIYADIEGGSLFAHLRDISRRIKREKEIKRNEERLESLLEISQHKHSSLHDLLDFTLNEAIVLTESKLGYIYFYDDKTQEFQLNTWSRDVMAECKIVEKNTVYQLEKTGIWGEAVRQGKPVMVNDFEAPHPLKKGYPEGHAVLHKYLTVPVFSDDRIVAVAGVANKITDYDEADVRQLTLLMNSAWKIVEWKRADRELRERTAQLEAANKELESFSYSVSHDLRVPLRAIDGYSRMILKKQGDQFDEDTKVKFEVIRNSTRVMGQLIDDLLALSRMGKQEMTMRKLDMGYLFKDVWDELKLANTDRSMTMTIGRMPPVQGDKRLMKQVVINLLSNAVKFTKHLDDTRIEAGAFGGDNEIVFYVRDNGAGFDMQYEDKLFAVFQRLHRNEEYEGTGVGLAIVQRIIHRHGGRVWAEGKIDGGACFYFTLHKLLQT